MDKMTFYARLGALRAAVGSAALPALMVAASRVALTAWTRAASNALAGELRHMGARGTLVTTLPATPLALLYAVRSEVNALIQALDYPSEVRQAARDLATLGLTDVESVLGTGPDAALYWAPSAQQLASMNLPRGIAQRVRTLTLVGYRLGNLIAAARYDAAGYSGTLAERRFKEYARLAMPLLTDYWSDVLVIDRDEVLTAIAAGDSMVFAVKAKGWGTVSAARAEQLPRCSLPFETLIEVGPARVRTVEMFGHRAAA